MTYKKFIEELENNQEWLETTEGDEVRCISIENLEKTLSEFLKMDVIIKEDL